MSSVIINAKPIIAPAANNKAYGRIARIETTATAPMTPAIGSTNPDNCPYQKLFRRENPSRRKGTDFLLLINIFSMANAFLLNVETRP